MSKKSTTFYFRLFFIFTSLLFIELLLRAFGYAPYTYIDIPNLKCDSNNLVAHQNLGYINSSKKISCSINNLQFEVNHEDDGSRVTGTASRKQGEIHFYGGSVTWGFGLNDSSTFPWLIQEKLKDYKIKNYSLAAGSNVQSVLWFNQTLSTPDKPDVVILNYSSFHDQRNTMSWEWEKVWYSILDDESKKNKSSKLAFLPYVDLKNKQIVFGKKKTQTLQLKAFLYSNSSLLFNLAEVYYKVKGNNDAEITRKLILEFQAQCFDNNINFIIFGITNDAKTVKSLAILESMGVKTLISSINFLANDSYNLKPDDGHPNKLANLIFSEELYSFLEKNIK